MQEGDPSLVQKRLFNEYSLDQGMREPRLHKADLLLYVEQAIETLKSNIIRINDLEEEDSEEDEDDDEDDDEDISDSDDETPAVRRKRRRMQQYERVETSPRHMIALLNALNELTSRLSRFWVEGHINNALNGLLWITELWVDRERFSALLDSSVFEAHWVMIFNSLLSTWNSWFQQKIDLSNLESGRAQWAARLSEVGFKIQKLVQYEDIIKTSEMIMTPWDSPDLLELLNNGKTTLKESIQTSEWRMSVLMAANRLKEALNIARYVESPKYIVDILINMEDMDQALDSAVKYIDKIPAETFIKWSDKIHAEGNHKVSFCMARIGFGKKHRDLYEMKEMESIQLREIAIMIITRCLESCGHKEDRGREVPSLLELTCHNIAPNCLTLDNNQFIEFINRIPSGAMDQFLLEVSIADLFTYVGSDTGKRVIREFTTRFNCGDVALRMFMTMKESSIYICDIPFIVDLGIKHRYIFHRFLPQLSNQFSLFEALSIELINKDIITALVMVNNTKKIPSQMEKLLRCISAAKPSPELMSERRKFIQLILQIDVASSITVKESCMKILLQLGDLRTAAELGLQILPFHRTKAVHFLSIFDIITKPNFETSAIFPENSVEEMREFAKGTMEKLTDQIFEPPYQLTSCVDTIVNRLKSTGNEAQAIALAIKTLRIQQMAGKDMAFYVLKTAESKPDIIKESGVSMDEYLQLCFSVLSKSSEWLFEGAKILLEMREPIRALEWARSSIGAPGEQDRGAICDVFCVVAQEYGDPQAAADFALAGFQAQPNLRNFQRVRETSDNWPVHKAKMLQYAKNLSNQYDKERLEIYLVEGLTIDAGNIYNNAAGEENKQHVLLLCADIIQRGVAPSLVLNRIWHFYEQSLISGHNADFATWTNGSTKMRILDKLTECAPHLAVQLVRTIVDNMAAHVTAHGNYEFFISWMRKARHVYNAAKLPEEWTETYQKIMSSPAVARKPKLVSAINRHTDLSRANPAPEPPPGPITPVHIPTLSSPVQNYKPSQPIPSVPPQDVSVVEMKQGKCGGCGVLLKYPVTLEQIECPKCHTKMRQKTK